MTDNHSVESANERAATAAEPVSADNTLPSPPNSRYGMYGLPRGLIIILGLAAAVIVAAGIHQVPAILGPVFLALVLTVTVDPIRGLMIRKGAPRWLASLTLVIVVFA
ncbi:MAG TPA: hypothetical protein VII33_15125, partial [Nakamurella sp.]